MEKLIPPPDFGSMSISSISRKTAMQELAISESHLRREVKVLSSLNKMIGLEGWDYQPYEKSFSVSSFCVLWVYRQLVQTYKRETAILKIAEVITDYFLGETT